MGGLWPQTLMGWSGTVVALVLGIAYLLSKLSRQSRDEAVLLAETRGHRVDDLEKEMNTLRIEVAELRAELKAVLNLKAADIAKLVLEGLDERVNR